MTSFEYIQDIILEQYSEKCFILKGNTIQYKQDIKQLGGMWNPSLKAWIFPISKREVIEKWLDKGEKTIEPIKQYFESPNIENYNSSANSTSNVNLNSRIDVLEKKMDMIIEMLNKIHCKEVEKETVKVLEKSIEKVKQDVKQGVKPLVKNTKENETNYEKEYEEYYEQEYEEVKPRKRLLVK